MTDTVRRQLPLFYRTPEPLNAAQHGDLRIVEGDLAFAADTNALPIVLGEFAAAMRHYPIVFAGDDGFPVAILGLGQGNRFVEQGRWGEGIYLPAYLRRYPFGFIDAGARGFALALDTGSERVVRGDEAGVALFEGNQPTEFTLGAMAFCNEFQAAHGQTRAFVEALLANDLLVIQEAEARLASGQPMRLGGFRVVDREAFGKLSDALVLEWHRLGWLALIHFHFASLDRFQDLLVRESALASATDDSSQSDAIVGIDSSIEVH
ncbi:SapC family protein [Sphingomonas sp. KR3-1]|uniref:SapC family protein n=1 Tax=Sphingomonas sp. KR3-1 TaxID=3156611 RepID=UPI0032B413CF